MATSAVSSHGTLLKIGNGATPTEVFTTIAEVKDITGPNITVATEEVTNHDSAGWTEHVATIKDGGEITLSINYYSATTQDTLETDMGNRTKRNFQIVFPLPASGTDTRAFAAYITGFQLNAPVSGVLTADVTLRTTGAVGKTVA